MTRMKKIIRKKDAEFHYYTSPVYVEEVVKDINYDKNELYYEGGKLEFPYDTSPD